MGQIEYHKIKIFGRFKVPPGLARSPFLFASAAATLNFGKNEWAHPTGADVVGLPEWLEHYWGLLLLVASAMAFLGLLTPARFPIWEWFYRSGLWSMFAGWALTTILLLNISASPSYIGAALAACVTTAAVVDILRLDLYREISEVDA